MKETAVDVAYSELVRKRSDLEALPLDANEAATRLRVIDTILFDVLDWEKEDVDPERYCRDEGYADYVCRDKEQKLLVIEAKRSGKTFVIPTDKLESRPYAFGFIASESKSAADALQQAIGYATILGTHYVAVTNGKQWMLTLTYVEGKELSERLVYVFESIAAVESRFRMFWQCFSKAQMTRHNVDAALRDILLKPAPSKASARIPGYPKPATRNLFQNELSYVLDYVWQVMAQDEGSADFVHNCYVSPDTHKDTIALVRELLTKRTSEDAVITQHEIQSVDILPQKIAHLPSEKPFVILGQIGRGKTSFLKYLRHVAVADILNGYIQIDLNFLDRPDESAGIPSYVYDEIERQLLDTYKIDIKENGFVRGVLHLELQRLKNTPRGKLASQDQARYAEYEIDEIEMMLTNRHDYLTKVFHHLKRGRKCSIAIFMDNLDRRTADIQEQAFLRASAMARDWASIIFICLRPDTFHRSREGGVLDTIAPTAFTVSHPDLALILKKRFSYAKSIADGKRKILSNVEGYSPNISMVLPNVSRILGSCEFAARKRHGIIPLLEAVSNGNIRRLLDFARSILCSGHLDTKKILRIIEADGNYVIPDFEGIKALLYGEYSQFSGIESPFINLFDIIHAQRSEHFLSICILHYLSRSLPESPSRGYASRQDLNAYLSGLGLSLQAIEECIYTLEEKNLVDTAIVSASGELEQKRYRITALGGFHLHYLCRIFQYLDAMTLDTPVLNAAVRGEITDTIDINERIKRTKVFIGYLDESVADINDSVITSFWKEQSEAARANIVEIESRIKPA